MAIVSLHIPPSSCSSLFLQNPHHHHHRTSLSLTNVIRCCYAVKSSSAASVTRSSNGTGVIWYKNDLRVDDHQGLVAAASQQHKMLVPIYVFDHRILRNFTQEMLELLLFALEDLRNSLKDLGSDLMIRFGRTESVIQDLVKEVSATNVYTQEEVEYDLRLVIENVKESLLGENSPEISLWSTPLYDTENMVHLPLSYDDFQRLNFNVHSPLSAPQLPGSAIDLAWGPLPTLDDLKEFMDESPYKLRGTWSSIKSSSAEKVLQNARNLISNGVTNGQSNMNSQTTRIKEKRVKNSAFVTKLGIFVGGGTNNVLNALAAYLRYLEGTARDDWQEVHARLRDAETREGASFGYLFGPALQLGVVSRRRVYYETIKYEKERNGGFLSPFGYSAASVAAVADHVCSREWYHILASRSQVDSTNRYSTRYWRWKGHIIQYAVMGSEGPAVLLVHGFGAFLEHYRDNITDIVEGGNRVWAITLLGFGRSEKPNVVYTELMWAELLRDFIVDVVREPVHLVGNSFGGYFVSIVAGLWPDLAKSVVLLNSAGHYVPGYSSVPPSKERKTSGIAWLGARGILFYLRLSLRNLVKRCYPTITERADEGLLNEMVRASCDPGALVVLESIFTFDPSIPLNYLFKGFENKVLIIRDAAKDSLGMTSGATRTHQQNRESWWFSEEVQSKVAVKQSRFRELILCRESHQADFTAAEERYKVAKREAKKAVTQAKEKAYEELYKKLDSKEGANDVFRIAKARERRRRDLGNVKYIKDEGGRTIVNEEAIRKRWGEYFSSLFNEGGTEGRGEEENPSLRPECYYSRIGQPEVKVALQKMGRNKAVGPDQIPIEAWRCIGGEGVEWLTRLFNKIFFGAKMPEEWRLSEVIPIYKNKGDVQVCCNYRGIKLLSHTMKLWERVIERRLRRETRVSENQFGFMPGRSSIEAIHLLRTLIEKYREKQRDLHMAFLDLEKAYDSVPRELIWRTLAEKGTPRRYVRVIKDMYEGAKTRVRSTVGISEFFPVEVGLHQGSAISPFLFALILDELSRGIQEGIPWSMIFADDIVLVSESAEGLNNRLEHWREALENNGLRVSREKTEYLRCDFGRIETGHHGDIDIRIGDRILPPKESFRYLGSMIHKSGGIDEDVTHRIRAGWAKWRAASGVLCDRKVPLKLKGKFYKVAIRPAMLYGSECWPISKALANRVEVAELRMLRWTCGKTLLDMIPNGVFRAKLEVENIISKMREGRLRWFGHVRRRPQSAPVRRVEALVVEGVRRRGRPKLRWEDRVKLDLKELLLTEDMTSDRKAWRDRIRICG